MLPEDLALLPAGWPPGFGEGPDERRALLVLAHLETLLPGRLRGLAWERGSARGVLAAVARGASSEGDRTATASVDPAATAAALADCGGRLVTPADGEYPPSLLALHDPPGWLFLRGRSLPLGPSVAMVGARRCSPYGREMAEVIARGIAAAGVAVVSGAARGIDAAAHRGALSGRGHTVAVLGSGIDVAYPPGSAELIARIAEEGTVASEYPPGTRAEKRRFPARNRIMVGLARALLVVEGAAGSGSRISAEFAEDLDVEMLALPGPVTSPLSSVPHELIRDGATLVRGPDDVLEALGLKPEKGKADTAALSALPPLERRVLAGILGPAPPADAIAAAAGVPVPAALSALVSLELRGLVRSYGGRFERTAAAGSVSEAS